MKKTSSMIIWLVLGLSIVPSIIVGTETPVPPGNSSLTNVLLRPKLQKRNASQIVDLPVNNTVAVNKVAESLIEITVPILGRLHRFPKYLKDLKKKLEHELALKINSTAVNSIKKPEELPPTPLVKILRSLIQEVWKDAWLMLNKRRMAGSVDGV